jgi:hypothetical protein
MHCPSCGAENPDDSRYCNLCLVSFSFAEDPEYTRSEKPNEGFMSEYPSIFRQPLPPIDPESDMKAEPIDIGKYGVRSGENMNTPQTDVTSAPVDVGRYGSQSGADPGVTQDTVYSSPGDPNAKKDDKKKRHLFRRER